MFQSPKSNIYNSRISACRAPSQIPPRRSTHARSGKQKTNHHHSSAPLAEDEWQARVLPDMGFFFFFFDKLSGLEAAASNGSRRPLQPPISLKAKHPVLNPFLLEYVESFVFGHLDLRRAIYIIILWNRDSISGNATESPSRNFSSHPHPHIQPVCKLFCLALPVSLHIHFPMTWRSLLGALSAPGSPAGRQLPAPTQPLSLSTMSRFSFISYVALIVNSLLGLLPWTPELNPPKPGHSLPPL